MEAMVFGGNQEEAPTGVKGGFSELLAAVGASAPSEKPSLVVSAAGGGLMSPGQEVISDSSNGSYLGLLLASSPNLGGGGGSCWLRTVVISRSTGTGKVMASSTGNSDLAEDGRSVDGRPTGVVSNRKGGGGGSALGLLFGGGFGLELVSLMVAEGGIGRRRGRQGGGKKGDASGVVDGGGGGDYVLMERKTKDGGGGCFGFDGKWYVVVLMVDEGYNPLVRLHE